MTGSKTRNANRARRWIERILLLAGLVGLGVWLGQNVVSSVWQAWASRVFDRMIGDGTSGDREIPGEPSRARPSSEGVIVGRLTIPRLHLSAMVREGVRERTLSLALGHVPNTAFPGQPGNVAVAGHRDTLFRDLRWVHKYDLIRFETPSSGSYLYQVSSVEIVDPTDVSVLRASRNSELTLVTCYPFNYIGSAPKRYIVKAREVDRAPGGVKGQQIRFP
jgi:sortase A